MSESDFENQRFFWLFLSLPSSQISTLEQAADRLVHALTHIALTSQA